MQQLFADQEDWEIKKLGDVFEERNELGFIDLELLSVGEKGIYPQSLSNKKDTSNKDKSKYKRILKGDIGYNTMRLWQGRCALSDLEGIVSPAYTILKIQSDHIVKFFAYYFKSPRVIYKFYQNSQGLVSDTLNCKYTYFKNIKLPIPPLSTQEHIAQVLSTADKEIGILEKKYDAMQSQKKGLMQLLLTGKKRLLDQ